MPQSHVVFGRNFKKKRECKDRNDYNMDDSTEIILFYSFSEVMGTRTPSSIVPDFLIHSPGFFFIKNYKRFDILVLLASNIQVFHKALPCQKYSLYLLRSPEGQHFRVAGWCMIQNSHRFWGCKTTEELESLVVSIIMGNKQINPLTRRETLSLFPRLFPGEPKLSTSLLVMHASL